MSRRASSLMETFDIGCSSSKGRRQIPSVPHRREVGNRKSSRPPNADIFILETAGWSTPRGVRPFLCRAARLAGVDHGTNSPYITAFAILLMDRAAREPSD